MNKDLKHINWVKKYNHDIYSIFSCKHRYGLRIEGQNGENVRDIFYLHLISEKQLALAPTLEPVL